MNTAPESATPSVTSAPASPNQTSSSAAILPDPAAEHKVPSEHAVAAARKREATITALLAIHRGHVVHRLRGGEYIVSWRGVSKHCRDLADLEAHARQVGAMR